MLFEDFWLIQYISHRTEKIIIDIKNQSIHGKAYILELDSWPAFIIKKEVMMISLDEVKLSASDAFKDFKQKAEMDEITNHRM